MSQPFENVVLETYPDLHLQGGEVLVTCGDFVPGQGVTLRKEFYLHGHCISREEIALSPDAIDTMMATWMQACSLAAGTGRTA